MGMNNNSNPPKAVVVGIVAAIVVWAIAISVAAIKPAKSAEAPKYTIELEQADLGTLSQALNELPKRLADPLIAKINVQLQTQAAKQQAETEAKTPPAPTPEPRK